MFQTKNQDKNPDKELNEIETNNLSDKQFKILVRRLPNELRRRLDELSENFNRQKL